MIRAMFVLSACASGFAVVGGFLGFLIAVLAEKIGAVKPTFYVDSLGDGLLSLLAGALTSGVFGIIFAIRYLNRSSRDSQGSP